MKLTDLNPWFVDSAGGRKGVGIEFDCPCGKPNAQPLYVDFRNPLSDGPSITERPSWERTGETFDTLTLRPSILRTFSTCGCKWHGYITDGEVVTV